MQQYGQYPENFYRVAAKAIIKNSEGFVFAMWDKDGFWNLPGGGVDHGESVEAALHREIHEEVGVELECTMSYNGALTYYSPRVDYCLMHLFFNLTPASIDTVSSIMSETAKFVDPPTFKASPHIAEQFIYKFAYDADFVIPFAV